ncbi:MAG: VOC family protein [Candidatus Poribacteria bacterium]|nr:VOC family protein [Candidatus Poribacteria bacterium]
MDKPTIHPQATIGHVHLTVADLDRAERFYTGLLGFEVTARFGDEVVFMSAGGYHHHIALNTWAGKNAKPRPPGTTGLYHFAILLPNRQELAKAVKRLIDHGVKIDGASDHTVSEAVYLRDPDGNGIELCVDRPPSEWVDADGKMMLTVEPLDLDSLLSELDAGNA